MLGDYRHLKFKIGIIGAAISAHLFALAVGQQFGAVLGMFFGATVAEHLDVVSKHFRNDVSRILEPKAVAAVALPCVIFGVLCALAVGTVMASEIAATTALLAMIALARMIMR